jgi:uncharacterized protein YbaP (TraB family)
MHTIIKSIIALGALFFTLTSFWKSAELTPADQQSLLWKIEGNGIKTPSYLFGTMHLIEKDYFYFPESLEKLVKKSDLLVMELGELPNQMEAMQYLTLKEGSFFDYFTPQQTDTILIWAKSKLNMDEKAFRATFTTMKPFVVVQTATQLQFIGKTESYELKLTELAKKSKVEIKGLETVAEQMGLFDKLTKEQQAEMVMAGIRDEEKSAQVTRTMQGMYRRQQLDSLYSMVNLEGGVISSEQNDFLDQRNRNWIPQIKNHVGSGKRAFFAVGAAHLGGEFGVINLLRKEGFVVTPVKF